MNATRLLLFAMLGALAGCGDEAEPNAERRTAAGEVLGGTINDEMLPLDTVTSQGPPMGPTADSDEDSPTAPASTGNAGPASPGPRPAPAAPESEPAPAPVETPEEG